MLGAGQGRAGRGRAGQGSRTYGTRVQNDAREDFLATRHSLLPQFFARPESLYSEECMYTHTHISDCLQTVYELPSPPNNTAVEHFDTNQERCEC
jgi:hypothetical protein